MPASYRNNINKAVEAFRPMLISLSIRNRKNQRTVYMAEFDWLEYLDLDNIKITVLVVDLKTSTGLFFYRRTESLIDCYIVISESLYTNSLDEVKFTGVHEFVHFMALIYLLSSTSDDHHRQILSDRMARKVDALSKDSLNRFLAALQGDGSSIVSLEFGDKHFRLDYENMDMDYSDLFNHFMLSKELFELYFTEADQKKFKEMLENNDDTTNAVKFYGSFIDKVKKDKNIIHDIAFNQALSWVSDYL